MSIHLVECAARLDLPASTKLALMAFADSADSRTGIGIPGLEHVQQWSGLGRSRALEVTADLVERGLLRKYQRGVRGRRAEYVVFPQGCCAEHPVLVSTASVPPDLIAATGSAVPDSHSGTGSTSPDPVPLKITDPPLDDPTGSDAADPEAQQGPDRVRQLPDPSPTTSTYPPNPPAPSGARGSKSCPRHATPAENCRSCGTTARQVRAAAAAVIAERTRAAAAAALAVEVASIDAVRGRPRSAAVVAELERTRRSLRKPAPEWVLA